MHTCLPGSALIVKQATIPRAGPIKNCFCHPAAGVKLLLHFAISYIPATDVCICMFPNTILWSIHACLYTCAYFLSLPLNYILKPTFDYLGIERGHGLLNFTLPPLPPKVGMVSGCDLFSKLCK